MGDSKDKENLNSISKSSSGSKSVPFEKRGSKSVTSPLYEPTIKVPKQPKRK